MITRGARCLFRSLSNISNLSDKAVFRTEDLRFVSGTSSRLFFNVFHSSPTSFGTYTMPLSDIPDVDIDPSGTFKYILIKCSDKTTNEEKYIVRGYYRCNFHADVLDVARNDAGSSFKLKCVGGGRIKHENDERRILVYGYSQGFGQADHSKTVDILKRRYPDYDINFSNDGY